MKLLSAFLGAIVGSGLTLAIGGYLARERLHVEQARCEAALAEAEKQKQEKEQLVRGMQQAALDSMKQVTQKVKIDLEERNPVSEELRKLKRQAEKSIKDLERKADPH